MQTLLVYIGDHPYVALSVIFLTAFAESVAIIGIVVPASVVMFAAGALVGEGTLDLWATLGVAVLGAIAGDGLSFELGRSYSKKIKTWPVVKQYGQAMTRGEEFVARHGGKSIIFARFFGPMRAVVPLVAGITHMPLFKFYIVNIISAAAWAPAHILPGVFFGASIRVAEAVTGRLALLLLLLVALIWGVVWFVRICTSVVIPRIAIWREQAMHWAQPRQSRLAYVVTVFLDPKKPESEILLVSAFVLVASVWMFFAVLQDVIAQDPLTQMDMAIFHFLQSLRTSATDRIMLGITDLGGVHVLLPLVLVTFAWFVLRRCWYSAGYWLIAAGFSVILVQLLEFTVKRSPPIGSYIGSDQFSFVSGHTMQSMVVYGFLAFLLTRRLTTTRRLFVTIVAAVLITLIGFSRLYLGVHWLSDVLGGFSLGLAWVTFLAMLYTHYRVNENSYPRWLAPIAVIVVAASGAWQITHTSVSEVGRYTVHVQQQTVSTSQWINTEWKNLPQQRLEIGGDLAEPLPLQWADSTENISQRMIEGGWHPAPEWSAGTLLSWLAADTSIKDLPVLPKFNQGDSSELAFIYFDPAQPMSRTVLRLWRSDYVAADTASDRRYPIWYAGLYDEKFRRPWHLVSIGVTQNPLEAVAFEHWPRNINLVRRLYTTPDGATRHIYLVLPLLTEGATE